MTSSHLLNKDTISNVDTSLTNTDLSNLSNTGESHFQTPLVSGNNIKTINSTSLLGSGDIIISAGAPTGSIMIWAGTTVPEGYLLCDGSAVSRTTYSALFSAIGTTYGAGDSSGTFNLPNFNGRYAIGGNVGTYISESLPNIVGYMGVRWAYGANTGMTAPFTITNRTTGSYAINGTSTGTEAIGINLSTSNSVYKNSAKVRPDSLGILYIIKY